MNPSDSKCSECEIIGQSNCSEHGTPNDSSDAAATKQESEVKTCAPTNATATQLEEGSKSSPGRQSESASSAAAGVQSPSDAAAQDKDSSGFFSQNERSWPDDALDEDSGSYQNVCCSCQKLFIGHKDRVMCKACFLANPDVAAALASERAKSEQLQAALIHEREKHIAECDRIQNSWRDYVRKKNKVAEQLQATVARLEAHAKDLEQRQEVIRAYVPQTAGDVVMAKWPLPPFEGHEWDNRTSEENAVWCLGEFRDIITRLEGELAEAKEGRKQTVDKWTLAEQEIKEERDQLRDQLAAEKAAHEETKRDLEVAKRERDEAREQADTVRGALIQQCLRAGMTVCTTEDATNLVEMLGTTLAEAQRREFERDEHDEQKQELGLRLLADRDSIRAQVEQLTADRDALAALVERLREALEKVASLINESTGVAGLHLNGEVAPWCDLMTGGKYEEWLCGVVESLQLDTPTALREWLEAETKPLVEALEDCLDSLCYFNRSEFWSQEHGASCDAAAKALAATKARLEGGK